MKADKDTVIRVCFYGHIWVGVPLFVWLRSSHFAYDKRNRLYGYEDKPSRGPTYWRMMQADAAGLFIANLGQFTRDWRASCISVWQILESPANAGLAAWEKANGITHPLSEKEVLALLDKGLDAPPSLPFPALFMDEASKQAAEPAAYEDPVLDEDEARDNAPCGETSLAEAWDAIPWGGKYVYGGLNQSNADDPVNPTPHYQSGGIEFIDAIRAVLTPEQFAGYCRGNAMKYLWRAGKKGRPGQTVGAAVAEDLSKARWYLDKILSCPTSDKTD